MARQIQCTRCGRQLTANRAWEGQQFNCEACGQINQPSEQVPVRRSAVNELLDTALADLPPPPVPPAAKRFPWLIVAAAALGVAVFGGAVAMLVSRLREESVLTQLIAASDEDAPRTSPPPRSATLPDWTADPDIVRQLADRVHFGQWSWRLPQGFEREDAPAAFKLFAGDHESWAWADAEADDTLLAAFHLDSGEMKRLNEPKTALVDSARLEAMFVQRLTRDLQRSYGLGEFNFMLGDSGRVAGRQFQRADFNGKNAGSNRVHGVMLFSREGRRLLVLVATSPLPPGDKRRAELVATMLTLKLK